MPRSLIAAAAVLLVGVSGYVLPTARTASLRMSTDATKPTVVEKALTSAIALPISLIRATRSEAENAQIDAAEDLETAVNSATNAAGVVGASVVGYNFVLASLKAAATVASAAAIGPAFKVLGAVGAVSAMEGRDESAPYVQKHWLNGTHYTLAGADGAAAQVHVVAHASEHFTSEAGAATGSTTGVVVPSGSAAVGAASAAGAFVERHASEAQHKKGWRRALGKSLSPVAVGSVAVAAMAPLAAVAAARLRGLASPLAFSGLAAALRVVPPREIAVTLALSRGGVLSATALAGSIPLVRGASRFAARKAHEVSLPEPRHLVATLPWPTACLPVRCAALSHSKHSSPSPCDSSPPSSPRPLPRGTPPPRGQHAAPSCRGPPFDRLPWLAFRLRPRGRREGQSEGQSEGRTRSTARTCAMC